MAANEKDVNDLNHPSGGTKTPPVSKGSVEQVGTTVPVTGSGGVWPDAWGKK
jgi:hypothetical protein